jgi:hypothetical protein
MEDKIITLKVKHNLEDVVKKVDKVNDSLDETKKEVDKISTSTKKAEDGIGKMAKSFSTLGVAIKGAGIGIALEAFTMFKDVLGSNQRILNAYNTTLNATRYIFTDLVKLVSGDLSISTFIDNIGKSVEKGGDLTKLRNDAKIAEALQQGLIEKFDRQAEIQRQIRDDETLTFDKRIKANQELGNILFMQGAEMQKLANMQIKAAQANRDLTPNNENEIALIQAKNNALAISAQVTGLESEQLVNNNSLLKERRDLIQESYITDADLAQAKADTLIAIQKKYYTDIQDLTANTEQEALDLYQRRRAEEIELITNDFATKADLYLSLGTEVAIKQNEIDKKATLERIGHLNAYADASMAVAQLVGQQTAEGKALAIAASLISTYAAIAGQLKAFSGVPIPGYAIAQAIATGAVGLAQVANIASVNTGSYNSGAAMANTPSAPRFNVVGVSPINQVAQAIGQNDKPVKAYVVSGEVSSAQSLDRNRITSATLG